MNKNEILEIIDNGENSYIEFKEEAVKPKDLGEEFVAFANSEGGTVIIGVADNAEIKGVKDELLRLFEGNGSMHFDISPVDHLN